MKTIAVKRQCPECEATHVRPEYLKDRDEPEPTIEGTCYAYHPARDAGFDGCGDEVDLEAIAWREDRDDEWIQLEEKELVTDGSGKTEWELNRLDCDFNTSVESNDPPDQGPPEEVEKRATRHKHATDQSHVIRVHASPVEEEGSIDPSLVTDGGVQTVSKTVTVEEALNGRTREDLDLPEDQIEMFIEWEKDLSEREAYGEIARERLDESEIPEAHELLWIDRAEVYALCPSCYLENKEGQWTGSTENPNYDELRQSMQERLTEGTPCAFCKSDRIDQLKEELRESDAVVVDVEVIE